MSRIKCDRVNLKSYSKMKNSDAINVSVHMLCVTPSYQTCQSDHLFHH